jgi:hypothetical protein
MDAERLFNGIVAVLDTTYFGRGFGLLAVKDAATGKNLFAPPVPLETSGTGLSAGVTRWKAAKAPGHL